MNGEGEGLEERSKRQINIVNATDRKGVDDKERAESGKREWDIDRKERERE